MLTRVILIIAATLVFVGVGLFAIYSMQPTEWVLERSAVIDAAPEVVFSQIEDFEAWQNWSPYAGADRELSFDGAHRGEGAVFEWSGDEEEGAGRLTIVESRPGEVLSIELETLKPVRSWSTMEFNLEPADDGTRVTWSMRSEMSLPMKTFISIGDMEERIGGDFEEGLTELAAVVESGEES